MGEKGIARETVATGREATTVEKTEQQEREDAAAANKHTMEFPWVPSSESIMCTYRLLLTMQVMEGIYRLSALRI